MRGFIRCALRWVEPRSVSPWGRRSAPGRLPAIRRHLLSYATHGGACAPRRGVSWALAAASFYLGCVLRHALILSLGSDNG